MILGKSIRVVSACAVFIAFMCSTAHHCSAEDCKHAKKLYAEAVATSNYSEKVNLYLEAIKLCPSFAEAHNNLADAYENLGKYDEAIIQYKKALNLKGTLSVAYFGLGDTYLKIGLYRKAIEAYTLGLRLGPNDLLAREGLRLARRKYKATQKKGIIPSSEIVLRLHSRPIQLMGPGGVRLRSSRVRFNNILFDFGSAKLRTSSIPQLREIGAALTDNSFDGFTFVIEGHTDSIGPDEYNMRLSLRRAQAVLNYLIENFPLQRERFEAKGYGETRPVSDNSTASGRAQNRRVEIVAMSH